MDSVIPAVRSVPGRNTDVADAAWIADLLTHGLIRSSFVPPAAIQELRDLTRTRKQQVREISQHSRRIQWAGLCPRNDESAGTRRSTRVRRSGTWLKTTLVTAAWASVRVKNSYLQSQFLRIRARRGAKQTILAVAASKLTAAYFILRDGVEYQDLGPDHFDRRNRTKVIHRLVRRLRDPGCQVLLTPEAA